MYLISRWAPPNEKATFVSSLQGVDIGSIITLNMIGVIIERLGWYWSFYIPAIYISIFAICSLWIVYDTPAKHPRLSPNERAYIEHSLIGVNAGPKVRSVFFR